MLETRAQANAAIDHAVAEMEGVKDATLAEFNTHKTSIVAFMQREVTDTFNRVNTAMHLAEQEFATKLNDVVKREVHKVNDARQPLDNIPEQMEAMRAQLRREVDNLRNPEFVPAKIPQPAQPKRPCVMCPVLEQKYANLQDKYQKLIDDSERHNNAAADRADNELAELQRQLVQKNKKIDQMLSYPQVKERLQLEEKVSRLPEGAVEDFASEKVI